MLEDAKTRSVTVHHRQKLQNVAWVISFCRRQLAALVCLRMLMTLIVGLREDGRGRHREAAGVRREHRSPAGVKGTQHRRRGEGLLQGLKTHPACALGDHTKRRPDASALAASVMQQGAAAAASGQWTRCRPQARRVPVSP